MGTLLYVENLTVSFDGFLALRNLNLIVERTERVRLLVEDPTLLLLDEPAAGMTRPEKERTIALIEDIVARSSSCVMLIEHDMEFVRHIARRGHRVTVLHEGTVLSEGSLDRVQADERVIEAYLGRGKVRGAA